MPIGEELVFSEIAVIRPGFQRIRAPGADRRVAVSLADSFPLRLAGTLRATGSSLTQCSVGFFLRVISRIVLLTYDRKRSRKTHEPSRRNTNKDQGRTSIFDSPLNLDQRSF